MLLGAVALLSGCATQRADPPALGLAANLEREVGVSEDLTVFTLFALLNAAGCDDENREAACTQSYLQYIQQYRDAADLRQYYPSMLARLDPRAELQCWRDGRAQR